MSVRWSQILLVIVAALSIDTVFSCRPGEYECRSYQQRWSCLPKSQLCDRKKDCHWNDDEQSCDVVPETTFYCDSGSPKGGYYKGRKIRCDCRVRGDNHKGFAQWIKDGVAADEPIETITLMSNATESNNGYRCTGQSGYGQQNSGTALEPRFAYLDKSTLEMSPTELTVCSKENSPRQVTCKIPKQSVNPAPVFSFHGDGKMLGEAQPAVETETRYEQSVQVTEPSGGGLTTISCHVTNTIFDDLKQEISKSITLRKPPAHPPTINVSGQTFQGVSSINVATLAQNFTGTLTCQVSGGFPEAWISSLTCGDNVGIHQDSSGTVRFQNSEVTRSMHQVDCSCSAEHESGCYGNRETRVKIKVMFSDPKSDGQSGNQDTLMIVIPVILVIVVVLLIIVIIILVLRQRKPAEGTRAEMAQLKEQKA